MSTCIKFKNEKSQSGMAKALIKKLKFAVLLWGDTCFINCHKFLLHSYPNTKGEEIHQKEGATAR
jgi:hypothetical protein